MERPDFYFPENKKLRVVIDSDAGCECDDLYAILHALMCRKADVQGIIAAQFGSPAAETMGKSLRDIRRLLILAGETVDLYEGEAALFEDESSTVSPGVGFLIQEARREDRRPLFLICQGALTNLAAALRQAPDIAERMTAIIIGGADYPRGAFEFNTMNDRAAFNYVMNSTLPLWVVPEEVYSTLQVSFEEVAQKVGCCGAVGRYLLDAMMEANRQLYERISLRPGQDWAEYALGFPNGESWSLGDSAGIGLLLACNAGTWQEVSPPQVRADGSYIFDGDRRKIRWYDSINVRFILEDFFAKIKYYYG